MPSHNPFLKPVVLWTSGLPLQAPWELPAPKEEVCGLPGLQVSQTGHSQALPAPTTSFACNQLLLFSGGARPLPGPLCSLVSIVGDVSPRPVTPGCGGLISGCPGLHTHRVRAGAWGYLEVEEERERLKKGTSGGEGHPSKKAGLPLPSPGEGRD